MRRTIFIIIFSLTASVSLYSSNLWAEDSIIKLDSSNGSSNFIIRDSNASTVTQIDSVGNMAINGCVRIDSAGAECTTAENLIVDGKIGVGKTAPAAILDLSSTNSALRLTRLVNASTISAVNGMIAYDSSENELQAYINGTWLDLNGNDFFVSKSGDTMSGSLVFSGVTSDIKTVGSEHLVLAPGSGNVGIGRSAPRAVLELSSTTKTLLISNGNVGIGTTNPTSPLEISGNFSGVSSGLYSVPTLTSASDCSANCFAIQGTLTLNSSQSVVSGISSSVVASGATTTFTKGAAFFGITPSFDTGSAVTTMNGILIKNQGAAGITRANGLYIEAPSGAASNYAAFLGGNVGVGYTAPGTVLAVNGNIGVGVSVAAERLIVSGGNVGIGYTLPGTALAVSGNIGIGPSVAAQRLIVTGGNVGIGYTLPGTALAVSGNVGIGKSTAGEVLDVNGNIAATVFQANIEAITTGTCSANGCTATATCSAGKVVVFGQTANTSSSCNTNPHNCSAFCTPGQTSCSITETGAGNVASVYVVCAKFN